MRELDWSLLPKTFSLSTFPSRLVLLEDAWKRIINVALVPGRGTRCPSTSPSGPQAPLCVQDSNSTYLLDCSEKCMNEFMPDHGFAQGLAQVGIYPGKLVLLPEHCPAPVLVEAKCWPHLPCPPGPAPHDLSPALGSCCLLTCGVGLRAEKHLDCHHPVPCPQLTVSRWCSLSADAHLHIPSLCAGHCTQRQRVRLRGR